MTIRDAIKTMNLEQINTRKAEIRELAEDENSNLDELTIEVAELEEREKEIGKNVEKRKKLLETVVNLDNSHVEQTFSAKEERKVDNIYATKEYRDAWAKSVRAGDNNIVQRFLTTQSQESAGVLIPVELQNSINDVFESESLLQRFLITTDEGLTEMPYVESKTDPEWHQEVDADGNEVDKKEKSVAFGVATLTPEYIAEILPTTKKFEALTIDAFFSWLQRELPNALRRKIIAGALTAPQTGTYGTRGILTNTDTTLVRTINKALGFNTVNEAVGQLGDELGELTVVMNKRTFYDTVMGLTDTTGRPIYTIQTDLAGKAVHYLNGIKVEFNTNFKSYEEATAGEAYMLVGDFKAYQLNFPLGLSPEITRDPLTRKKNNIIEYLSEILVGGNIVKRDSFAKVTKTA